MKLEIIRETLKNKSLKKEFALLTNLINGESEIFFPGHDLSEMFSKYSEEIEKIFNLNKSGIIENSEIFVQTYKNPIISTSLSRTNTIKNLWKLRTDKLVKKESKRLLNIHVRKK